VGTGVRVHKETLLRQAPPNQAKHKSVDNQVESLERPPTM
jgi:hypothetical protein